MPVEFTHQFNFTKDEAELLILAFGAMLLSIKEEDMHEFRRYQEMFCWSIRQELIDSIEQKLVNPLTTKA